MPISITEGILATAVPVGGSFNVAYPAGTEYLDYEKGSVGNKLVVNQATLAQEADFTVSYEANYITLTNATAAAFPEGALFIYEAHTTEPEAEEDDGIVIETGGASDVYLTGKKNGIDTNGIHSHLVLGIGLVATSGTTGAVRAASSSQTGWGLGIEHRYLSTTWGEDQHEFYVTDSGSVRPLDAGYCQAMTATVVSVVGGVVTYTSAIDDFVVPNAAFVFTSLAGASGISLNTKYVVRTVSEIAGVKTFTFADLGTSTITAAAGNATNTGSGGAGALSRGGYGNANYIVPVTINIATAARLNHPDSTAGAYFVVRGAATNLPPSIFLINDTPTTGPGLGSYIQHGATIDGTFRAGVGTHGAAGLETTYAIGEFASGWKPRFQINAGGKIAIGYTAARTALAQLDINGQFMSATSTPASASATGVAGTWAWDASFIYICTATNTWKRVAIATW